MKNWIVTHVSPPLLLEVLHGGPHASSVPSGHGGSHGVVVLVLVLQELLLDELGHQLLEEEPLEHGVEVVLVVDVVSAAAHHGRVVGTAGAASVVHHAGAPVLLVGAEGAVDECSNGAVGVPNC